MTGSAKEGALPTETKDRFGVQGPFGSDLFGDPARGVELWLATGLRYAQWLQEIAALQSEVAGAMARNLVSGTTEILSAKSYEDCAQCQAQLVTGIAGTATSAAQKLAEATRRCNEDVMSGCMKHARPASSSSQHPSVGVKGEPIEAKTAAQ